MTSRTGRLQVNASNKRRTRRGFTLIELILVMALLVITMGVVYPALRGFFRGRTLDSEARRLLSLTRYGQSRAVAEGVPMVLWLDAREGAYGLATAPGYADEDRRAVEFTLDEKLELEVSSPPVNRSSRSPMASGSSIATGASAGNVARPGGRYFRSLAGLPVVRFLPDGFIDTRSPEYVLLRESSESQVGEEGQESAVWIVQNTNRLYYAIQLTRPQPVRW